MVQDNSYGQLGHGHDESYDMINVPRVVKALSGQKIGQIAAGDRHCIALSYLSGKCFTWGHAATGALGLKLPERTGSVENVFIPQEVKYITDMKPYFVAAGYD